MPYLTEAVVTRFGPGDEILPGGHLPAHARGLLAGVTPKFTPGDFILTHSSGLTGRLIRFGQSLRYGGADAKYTRWNHAALIVSPEGDLIEAVGKGILLTPMSHYRPTERYLVHLGEAIADARDREQIVKFAEFWREKRPRYGFMTIASVAISLVTGWRFIFGIDGQFICSGLVAGALERSATIFDRTPSNMMPADLAKHFDIGAPAGHPPRGVPPRPAADGTQN
jgi:hypothetical protein